MHPTQKADETAAFSFICMNLYSRTKRDDDDDSSVLCWVCVHAWNGSGHEIKYLQLKINFPLCINRDAFNLKKNFNYFSELFFGF